MNNWFEFKFKKNLSFSLPIGQDAVIHVHPTQSKRFEHRFGSIGVNEHQYISSSTPEIEAHGPYVVTMNFHMNRRFGRLRHMKLDVRLCYFHRTIWFESRVADCYFRGEKCSRTLYVHFPTRRSTHFFHVLVSCEMSGWFALHNDYKLGQSQWRCRKLFYRCQHFMLHVCIVDADWCDRSLCVLCDVRMHVCLFNLTHCSKQNAIIYIWFFCWPITKRLVRVQ